MNVRNADRLIYIGELVRMYVDLAYSGAAELEDVLEALQDEVEAQLLDAGLMEMRPGNGTRTLLPTRKSAYTTGMPVYSPTTTGGMRLNNPARLTSIQGGE